MNYRLSKRLYLLWVPQSRTQYKKEQNHQHMHTNAHSPFGFFFFSKQWLLLLGSWQFVLSKWDLPVPLPCPSLDVVQCHRSQTELSLRGMKEKMEKLPPDDNALTHGFTIQWLQRHRNTHTHTHKQEYARSHTLKRSSKLKPCVSYIKVILLTASCGTS